jgi:hypothetical protein
MYCATCGLQQQPNTKYCVDCGGSLSEQLTKVQEATPAPTLGSFDGQAKVTPLPAWTPAPKTVKPKMNPKKKAALIWGSVGLVILFIVLAAIPGLLSPLTYEQIPAFNTAFLHSEQMTQAQGVCSDLQGVVPSSSELKKYTSRTAAMQSNATTLRRAKSFVDSHYWAVSGEVLKGLQSDLDGVLHSSLVSTAIEAGILGLGASNASVAADKWIDDFRPVALETCGLTDKFSRASAVLSSYDTELSSVLADAAKAPWYPEGYQLWLSDPSLAWKWDNSYRESCYDCNYAAIKVVARDGCSGDLYGEVDWLQSGVAVDYSNDITSSVAPGEVNRLVFEEYPSDYYTVRMSTLECN